MSNENINQAEPFDGQEIEQPEMLVNEYGETKDSAVVVEESTRTVLLTNDETIVFEKEPRIDISPKNRPRKVYAGMWGRSEITTVGMAMLAVLTVILLYVFLVVPSNKELEKNRSERDRLEKELASARAKYGDITSTETQVAKLVSSVEDFETNNLRVADVGRNALYQRINGLIAAYGLVNTTGPDFVPLETADQAAGQQTEAERGRSKHRSLFPGVYVTMTVEGSYQNLRRFIREIETGNEFVAISAVELQPSDSGQNQNAAPAGPPGPYDRPPQANPTLNGFGAVNDPSAAAAQQPKAAGGKTHGEVVTLRIEMAAYFRRANFAPQQAPAADSE
jgi:Type II secretion system (T2SS), protein M subtype b